MVLPPISELTQPSVAPLANNTETKVDSSTSPLISPPLVSPPLVSPQFTPSNAKFMYQQAVVPFASDIENVEPSLTELISESISFDTINYFSAIETQTCQTQPLISTPEISTPETSTPETSTPETSILGKPKRKHNECACFIKSELTKVYSHVELAEGRVGGSKRKYKAEEIQTKPLSPTRLKLILSQAKKKYKLDYEKLNINEIINSKCRQIKMKSKNNVNLE